MREGIRRGRYCNVLYNPHNLLQLTRDGFGRKGSEICAVREGGNKGDFLHESLIILRSLLAYAFNFRQEIIHRATDRWDGMTFEIVQKLGYCKLVYELL